MDSRVKRDPTAQKRIVGAVANTYRHGRAETMDAVEKLVAARVASLSTRRVERFKNSCIGSVRVIPL
jgi:hypothetical protein